MALDISTQQRTGLTLEAELWQGNVQESNVGQVSLTESGTSGFYYATGVSLSSVANGEYYIRIKDTVASSYLYGSERVVIENEKAYEDYMIDTIQTVATLSDLINTENAIVSHGNANWATANISGLATQLSVDNLNDLSTADIDARLAAYDAPTLAEMTSAFTEIKGAGWTVTDTLEAIRDAITAGATTPADIYAYFTSGSNEDAFKADVSGLGGVPELGYVDGFVYLDLTASNTNTVNYTDGIITNPVSTWAAAITIANSLGTKRIFVMNENATITVTASIDDHIIDGMSYRLALNGQSMTNATIRNAKVSGTFTCGATFSPRFENCLIQSAGISGDGAILDTCTIVGDLTSTGTSAWFLINCLSQGEMIFDANGNIQHLGVSNFGGSILYTGGVASSMVSLTGSGRFTNDSGSTITTLEVTGNWDYINNGTVTTLYEDDINTRTRRVDGLIEDSSGDRFTAKALETAPTAEMDAAELHTGLDSYTNKANWMADVSGLATAASITALQSHGDTNWSTATGFSTHNAAAVYAEFTSGSNEDVFKADVSALALEASLDDIKGATFDTATDSLEAIRDRGDAAWTTGAGSSLTEADIYTYFTDASREDAFKADVSLLATAASITALQSHGDTNWSTATGFSTHNAAAVYAEFTSGSNEDVFKADVSALALEASLDDIKGATFDTATDSLEAIRDRGDAAWTTGAGSSLTEADIYTYFTDASREDAFKADVSLLATAASITALQSHGDTNWSTATGFSTHNAAAVYAEFTSGSNEDVFKADVSALALEASLDDIKGATFDTATDSLEAIRDRGDAAWLTGGAGALTAADIYNYFTDLSREDVFKADENVIAAAVANYDISGISTTDALATILKEIKLSARRAGQWGNVVI